MEEVDDWGFLGGSFGGGDGWGGMLPDNNKKKKKNFGNKSVGKSPCVIRAPVMTDESFLG